MKYKTRPRTAYLAARYGRRDEMFDAQFALRDAGIIPNARWIESEQTNTEESLRKWAINDYEDVCNADFLIYFSEDIGPEMVPGSWGRGGRHVEYGIALAQGLDIVVIGPKENIFHWFEDREDRILHFDTLEDFCGWYVENNQIPDDAE